MPGLVLILGIVLLIRTAFTAENKKVVSGITSVILFGAIGLFVTLTAWLTYKVPAQAQEMIGQAAGYVIILLFFAAIGAGIRKIRLLRLKKKSG
jgi:FtsH-binding integral membrane protein